MNRKHLVVFISILSIFSIYFLSHTGEITNKSSLKTDKMLKPSDWFYYQRAYPLDEIPMEKYFDAMKIKQEQMQTEPPSALVWQAAGPYNVGGRISAVVVDPANPNIIIIGGAAGGILKSTNGGTNWVTKTDFTPSLSTGALVMDPANSNIIYCGTGEGNNAIDNYPGFGVLKSTDKGETWNVVGLQEALHIPAMDIHPLNTSILYAAVMGIRSFSQDKGIYKSTNAGVNWTRVLFVSDSTSGVDVNVDPTDPNIVYAAMFERVRTPPSRSKTGGITSGLYRSSNGGANWTLLGTANGLPAPSTTTGRITIGVSKSNPNYVYALYATTVGNGLSGFYKSTNKGLDWTQMSLSGVSNGGFSWYFGLVEVDPTDPNKVYIGDVDLWRSTNGGSSWTNITFSYQVGFENQHPDQHALWINPANTANMINGNDGGMFTTTNNGTNWIKKYDLPLTQFYAATIDYQLPQRLIGGTQDNGTPRTTTGSLTDWASIYGGDGFYCLIDYTNSNIIYAESQWGGIGRSTNGGSSFSSIQNGLDLSRTNWSSPYTMDLQDPSILYFGSYKIFKTTNRGSTWTAISPDLTRGPNGRLGTITCVTSAVLPNSERVIYTGTDDAKVSVTTNSGLNWTDVTGILPQRYVTDVLADKRNPAIAYVTLSGFNIDQKNTHIYRTTNYGVNWTNISSNLLNVPANSIIIDYNYDSVLYVGCDAGVYYTTNLGGSWQLLGTGLPNSPVYDINYHQPTKTLVAATHGRSMYKIDVTGIIGIEPISNTIPDKFSLSQNYPNPFNPATTIRFSIPPYKGGGGDVSLKVYDILGSEVATLVNQQLNPGTYEVEWDASEFSSGIYFYSLTTEGFNQTKRMILIK